MNLEQLGKRLQHRIFKQFGNCNKRYAEAVKVSPGTVSMVCHGKRVPPEAILNDMGLTKVVEKKVNYVKSIPLENNDD